MTEKNDNAYKTIGEVAKILGLKSKKNRQLPTHTIRFWETKFKQIKPKLLDSKRRYYDQKTIDILRKIKFLLKDQGMTINGVKKILSRSNFDIDEKEKKIISTLDIKFRLNKITNLLKSIKKS